MAYPSYTLTIADGVSPVAIGRPKRYQLCLHCVLSRRGSLSCVAPFSLSFPERICFPADSLRNAAAVSALEAHPPASPPVEDDQ